MSVTTVMTLVAIVASLVAMAALHAAWRARRLERERSDARVAALAAALDPDREGDRPLLAPRAAGPAQVHPLLTIGIGFAAVSTAIIVGAIVTAVRTPPPASAAAGRVAAPEPALALLALRYEQNPAGLVVKGLVQNRGAVPPAAGVTAVVAVFNREGRLLARNSGPLRLQSRAPGARADFAVRLDGVAEVARYQVGFRGTGGIIRHVDLRGRPGGPSPAGAAARTSRVASYEAGSP
jgi:hypothetical protein